MRHLSTTLALIALVAVASAPTAQAAPPQPVDTVVAAGPPATRVKVEPKLTPAPSVVETLILTASLSRDSLEIVRATFPVAERARLSMALAMLGKSDSVNKSTSTLAKAVSSDRQRPTARASGTLVALHVPPNRR